MKNKFLLFPSLFLFGLLAYLIYSQISFASISSVTTNAPSVGKTSVTLSGTATLDGASELYDRRGFNLGTATAAGGNYNMGSSSDTGGAGTGSFTHATTTGLSKGTAYYFRAYSASSTVPQLVYGSEVIFLTGIDDPASLAKIAATEASVDLSWTKGTGAGNTYIRYQADQYPTSITDGTAGCATGSTACTVVNLKCNQSYYFRAWSSTTAAGLTTTSDSYAQLTNSTGRCSGGGGRTLVAPTIYPDSLVINNGVKSTAIREVDLSLKAAEASHMTVSNDTFFLNPLETYSTNKKWTLTEGDGVKTVYVKFLSQDGVNSDIVLDTITLETPPPSSTPTPTPTPTPPPASEPTPAPELTPEPTPAPAEKPISQMTKEELGVKITEILAQIEVLKFQLAEFKKAVTFEVNLKYGDRGDEVVKLQEVLIEQGLLAQGLNTGWFGSLTKAALIIFQEKYASEILIPSGLTKGTGFVGSATRAKLNELLGN